MPGRRLDRRTHQDRELAQAADAARNVDVSGPIGHTFGSHGSQFPVPPLPRLRLFEITQVWTQETRAKPWPTGWWYALGKRVLYYLDNQSSSGDWLQEAAASAQEHVLWYSFDDAKPPATSVGDRLWATFNMQSGFWEIVSLVGVTWWFELAEDLPIYNGAPVNAYRRTWNPSLHSGYGGYETDYTVTFLVADWTELGYCGYGPTDSRYLPYHTGGAYGAAELRQSDNGVVGVIVDMECPIACKCFCEVTSSSSSSGA